MASVSQKASPAAGRHTIRNQAPAPAAPPDWRKREAFLARWATAEELEGSQELAASPDDDWPYVQLHRSLFG